MSSSTKVSTEKGSKLTPAAKPRILETRLKSASSQTYPGKMELHMEELLSAFQSMESQVLKIVQKSYEDQSVSDATVNSIEITRLQEKIE